MNKKNNIFLVGFMGSGKTTLGKKLAKKLNKVFFDLDMEIEKEENNSVNELFEENGEAYFRKIESKILKKIINDNESFVMSLGGGTPCFFDNMSLINQSGTSIYLKYSAGILTHRLMNAKMVRPLIKGKSKEELIEFIDNKVLERERFYNQSQFIVEKSNIRVEDLLVLNLLT